LHSFALAGGFVEEDGGGSGGVEGLNARGHGNGGAGRGGALDFFREAGAFVADEKGDGFAPVHIPGGEGGFVNVRRSGKRADFGGVELREENRKRRAGKNGEMERGSGGSAKSFWGEGAGSVALAGSGSDGCSGTESGGGAKDGADVAGVLDAGENDHKWGGAGEC